MKQIKTTVKLSQSHDRLGMGVKFADGTDFRFNSSRGRDSLSTKSKFEQADLQALFKFCLKLNDGETFGQRHERLAKFFEKFDNLKAALAAAKA